MLMARATLDRLDQKLDNVIERLQTATKTMEDHMAEDRLMYIKVDRLDQNEQRRQWHIRALWTTILASGITWLIPK